MKLEWVGAESLAELLETAKLEREHTLLRNDPEYIWWHSLEEGTRGGEDQFLHAEDADMEEAEDMDTRGIGPTPTEMDR